MQEEQIVLLNASGRAIIAAEAGHSAEELLPCWGDCGGIPAGLLHHLRYVPFLCALVHRHNVMLDAQVQLLPHRFSESLGL